MHAGRRRLTDPPQLRPPMSDRKPRHPRACSRPTSWAAKAAKGAAGCTQRKRRACLGKCVPRPPPDHPSDRLAGRRIDRATCGLLLRRAAGRRAACGPSACEVGGRVGGPPGCLGGSGWVVGTVGRRRVSGRVLVAPAAGNERLLCEVGRRTSVPRAGGASDGRRAHEPALRPCVGRADNRPWERVIRGLGRVRRGVLQVRAKWPHASCPTCRSTT